MTSDN